MNSWIGQGVFHWAHQGGARENPSNTLRAMRHALAVGADGLELDVHATSDGKLVVAHDDELRRMTGAPGRIATSTLEALKRLDAAYNWVPGEVDDPDRSDPADYLLRGRAPDDPELQIPELREVLELFPATPLNLELKARGFANELGQTLLEHGRTEDVIVVSFRDRLVSEFRRATPAVGTAPGRVYSGLFWLASQAGIGLPNRGHLAVQLPYRKWGIRFSNRRLMKAARARDLAVHLWTVDERRDMNDAVGVGVNGIMTDRPSVLADVLRERDATWKDRGG